MSLVVQLVKTNINFHISNKLKKAGIKVWFLCAGVVLLYCVSSCTTKKNTFFYRAYHGTTTRFNIYFNGNESYKEAVELIDQSVVDNYTAILPVFPRPPKIEALKASPQLDRSIEKCSKAIKKHSMLIKGIEHCKPIDDCYLLMGKAYFQRQDFSDAMSVFTYILNTHKTGNVFPDANTWKARTNLALNRTDEAEVCLEEGRLPVEESKDKSQKLHWEATYSEFLLTQKNYELAIVHLNELLKFKDMKKDFKTRIHFILAQVYQEVGQKKDAADNYALVLKRNPAYEMDFNAVINLALCGANDKKSKSTAREKLKKMLKDEINETYKDQIFYALAQLDLKDEQVDDAIKNLIASVYWSINNVYQKTVSSLALAEIYFERNQYVESQEYYDIVIKDIPPTFPDYEEIKTRATILKNLVENLMLVNTQDSLQRIAAMGEKERIVYIDQLIVNYNQREAERIADEEEKARMMENNSKRATANRQAASSGAWEVFYNPTQVRFGSQEFRKRWGNRPLEDYWFLNDINVSTFFSGNQTADLIDDDDENSEKIEEVKQTSRTTDPQNRDFYLQDVPFTPKQIQASNELIATGLYNSGTIYSDDLYEYQSAVKQWEEFLKRFPEHKLRVPIYFQLYETYAHLNEPEKSDYYKNIILEQHPNTNYARIILNPDFYKEIALKQKDAEDFYASVYNAYKQNDYSSTVNLATTGLEKYPLPTLAPKFEYLKAISLGKLHGNDTLIPLLTEIINNYPATAIDTAATDLLEALKQIQLQQPTSENTADTAKIEDTAPAYVYDERSFHFVIILANIKEVRVDQLKGHLNAFSKEYFRLQQFDISNFYIDIDNATQMVTISRFENKDKAMDYYNLLKVDNKHVGYLKDTPSTKIYVISAANYNTFFRQNEKRSQYDSFFNENYLKK